MSTLYIKTVLLVAGIFFVAYTKGCMGKNINCQAPPQLMDPLKCCKDAGVDSLSETCFERIVGKGSNVTLSMEITSCLSECSLKEVGYLQEDEMLNLDNIRLDLHNRFPTDGMFVDTMVESFAKCSPVAKQKMEDFRELPLANDLLKRTCNPFSAIILGCTFIEYFKSCPKHLWLDSDECNLTKEFLKNCS